MIWIDADSNFQFSSRSTISMGHRFGVRDCKITEKGSPSESRYHAIETAIESRETKAQEP